MKTTLRQSNSRRGSLLIVAMLFSAIIAIALTSYIRLSRTTLNISNRAFYNNAAMNLAEQGLEEAMYSINKHVADSTYTWSGWTVSGNDAYREWTGVQLSQNTTADIRVYFYNYSAANTAAKSVVSRSRVTLGGVASAPIDKWIQVTLAKTSKFANGLVAKNSITFNGNNSSVDSWNSDPNKNKSPIVPYSIGVRRDNGSVASASVAVGSVAINNADIWGYVATGGAQPSVGSNGLVGPFGTSSGTVNPANVRIDFKAEFDPVTAPGGFYNTYAGAITTSVSLPRGTDVVGAGGYYQIEADSVNFTNETLTITDKVILKLTNNLTAISIGGGSGALNIAAGAELKVYGAGDFDIGGQGLMNGGTTLATANQPINCQFWGTKTAGVQDFKIAGNGILSAVVYAPQANLKINGNGDVSGAFVANNITVVGNAIFHYDESLADFGVASPFRIASWKELTAAADRSSTVAAVINW